MTAITRQLDHTKGNLRPFDVRRDLNAVADLVERCFSDTLDAEGRRYIDQMHAAARNPHYLRWAATVAERVSMPLSGYVWEEDGFLVGNLSLIPFSFIGRRFYLIANVAVDPRYRRRGIARNLTQAALDHARQRHAYAVWLHVRAENNSAIRLYQSLGFQERARRTTWEGRGGAPQTALTQDERPTSSAKISLANANDWSQQRAWLERLYPPEVNWHMPFNLNALRPDLWGGLYRFITGQHVKQWAAKHGNQLLGVLSWQPMANRADYLWLATRLEHEEETVRALLAHVLPHIPPRRQVTLDYPAGRAGQSFTEAGLQIHQTLIWMNVTLDR